VKVPSFQAHKGYYNSPASRIWKIKVILWSGRRCLLSTSFPCLAPAVFASCESSAFARAGFYLGWFVVGLRSSSLLSGSLCPLPQRGDQAPEVQVPYKDYREEDERCYHHQRHYNLPFHLNSSFPEASCLSFLSLSLYTLMVQLTSAVIPVYTCRNVVCYQSGGKYLYLVGVVFAKRA